MNILKRKNQKGFTLVEIVVVVGIFAVVSSILLFNYADFSTRVTLRNLTQEVALSIRKTQTLATSVRGADVNNAFASTRGYGIAFKVTPESIQHGGGGFSYYDIFRDENGDGLYNEGPNCGSPTIGSECLERFHITTGDRIFRICTPGDCTNSQAYFGRNFLEDVVIYFRRPNPDARIYRTNASTTPLSYVDIHIASRKGARMYQASPTLETASTVRENHVKVVRVWNTGQIGVLP
jgi:prepilin-type N-terminal cleavage/methylation domain-containing protein